MKIYSTRHGETDYNRSEIILGTTDVSLNSTGISQAEELAERISQAGDVNIIISSPMKRSVTTAEIVGRRCTAEVQTDERLREWNYGEYEGKPRFAEHFQESKAEFGVKMGKTGESLLQFSHRVYSALDDIIKKYSKSEENVLLVTHGGVCRVIETYFHDMTVSEYNNWFMDNCGIILYTIA